MDEPTIRLATEDDQDAVVACVAAAYRIYLTRLGRKPAPMLADYGALIAPMAGSGSRPPRGPFTASWCWSLGRITCWSGTWRSLQISRIEVSGGA